MQMHYFCVMNSMLACIHESNAGWALGRLRDGSFFWCASKFMRWSKTA